MGRLVCLSNGLGEGSGLGEKGIKRGTRRTARRAEERGGGVREGKLQRRAEEGERGRGATGRSEPPEREGSEVFGEGRGQKGVEPKRRPRGEGQQRGPEVEEGEGAQQERRFSVFSQLTLLYNFCAAYQERTPEKMSPKTPIYICKRI